ncbi:MAG: efflux RND transporter periplasmic adaptor subunit [Pirellula sp.]|nr:efflux RND transporter periplasmic adaptor subunit [Pirellula sp.]
MTMTQDLKKNAVGLFLFSSVLANCSTSRVAEGFDQPNKIEPANQVSGSNVDDGQLESQPKSNGTATESIKLEGAMLKTIDSTAVSAQVAGVLSDATLKEGALVKKGQSLAKIHDASVRMKLQQLKLQLDIARFKKDNTIDKQVASKNREVAEKEYERAVLANQRVPNTYPLNEVDRLKLVAERSRLEEERADYNMQMAALEAEVTSSEYTQTEELLSRHSIVSPVEGLIVAVEKKLGEWVEPGTEVYRIVRTDTLRIEGLIPVSVDDGNLIGRTAKIELIRGENRDYFFGKVAFVSPDVNPVNSLVRVFVEVDNPGRKLRPGLQVRAEIIPAETRDQGGIP